MAVRVGGWVREGGGLRLAPPCRLTVSVAVHTTGGSSPPRKDLQRMRQSQIVGRHDNGIFVFIVFPTKIPEFTNK